MSCTWISSGETNSYGTGTRRRISSSVKLGYCPQARAIAGYTIAEKWNVCVFHRSKVSIFSTLTWPGSASQYSDPSCNFHYIQLQQLILPGPRDLRVLQNLLNHTKRIGQLWSPSSPLLVKIRPAPLRCSAFRAKNPQFISAQWRPKITARSNWHFEERRKFKEAALGLNSERGDIKGGRRSASSKR